jgi:hypothetical protein
MMAAGVVPAAASFVTFPLLVLALVLAPVLALVGLDLVPGLWTNLWVAAPHGQVAYLSKLREQEDLQEAWAHEWHSCQSTPLS